MLKINEKTLCYNHLKKISSNIEHVTRGMPKASPNTGCETTVDPLPQPQLQQPQKIYVYNIKNMIDVELCCKISETWVNI